MANGFFKIKNGLNIPTHPTDPTVTPPTNSAVGDMLFYDGKLYRYNGTAWVVTPGSGTTGLITDADVDNAAAIAGTKVVSNFGSQNVTTSGAISTTGTGTITSAGTLRSDSKLEVIASTPSEAVYIEQAGTGNALIIADQTGPDTTAVVVDASGNMGVGVNPSTALSSKLTVAGGIRVNNGGILFDTQKGIDSSGFLNVGTSSTTTTINIATSTSAQSINLGAGGSGVTTINLGGAGDSIIASTDIKFNDAKGIESSAASSTLNIGTGSNTTTLNLGTGSSTQTVNIGTGSGTTTINIGGTGDSVVIAGTLTTVNTTNLDVADKNITLNKGGLTGSANGSGINIEAAGSPVASIIFDQTDGGTQAQNTFYLVTTGALALPSGTTVERPGTPSNGMIRYNSTNGAFEGYASGAWSGIGGGGTVDKVNQASHGFVVGDVLYLNGSVYTKAIATSAAAAEVVGVVSRVLDASNFELTLNGEISGLTSANFQEGSLPPVGEAVFLSATQAGKMSINEPSVVGQISLPVGVISASGMMYVAPKRGSVVGGANLRTQISLANNATTTIQNASAYDAGELAGWVYIDGTTDSRFYVQAQFAKKGAAVTDYDLAYQTVGDTPPAGFNVTITNAGLIQVVMPSIAGFSSASINFALNAPAVGATLPLQIDGGLVTGPVLGNTSGVIPAGRVGETKSATVNTLINLSTTNGTSSDIPGLSLSLEPGRWEVIVTIGTGTLNWGSGAGTYGYAAASIRDSANNTIAVQAYLYAGDSAGATNPPLFDIRGTTIRAVVSPTTTTTYKASQYLGAWAGTPVFNGNSIRADVLPSSIVAVRIA